MTIYFVIPAKLAIKKACNNINLFTKTSDCGLFGLCITISIEEKLQL